MTCFGHHAINGLGRSPKFRHIAARDLMTVLPYPQPNQLHKKKPRPLKARFQQVCGKISR